MIMQLPGMSGIGGSLGLIATGGPLGAVVGGLQILANVLGYVTKQAGQTAQMMVGLHWAATRVGTSIGSLYGADVLGQMMGGVPYKESAMSFGLTMRMYPSILASVRKAYPDLADQYLRGDPSKWDTNRLQIAIAERIAKTSSSFLGGLARAEVYGISPEVYEIASTPEGAASEQEKLKKIDAINKRTGFKPEEAAEAADKLNDALIELRKTFEITFMKTTTDFINFLVANKEELITAFETFTNITEVLIKAATDLLSLKITPEQQKMLEHPFTGGTEPSKEPGFMSWDWWKEKLGLGGPDQKKQADATQKQTDATEKNTDALNKIVEAGTTFTALESGGIAGLPAWGDKGGGGGGGGGGYGGGGSSRTPPPPKGVQKERAMKLMQALVDKGWSPTSAAIAAGNVQIESSFDPEAKGDPSVPGGSHGLVQWNRERLAALKAYASSQGKPWTDFDTQVNFLDKEWREKYHLSTQEKDFSRAAAMGHKYEGYATATAGSRVGAGQGILKQYQDRAIGAKVPPIGAHTSSSSHTDNRDQSINHPVTINVTGFDDPQAAGRMVANSLDDTQQRMVRNFRTKVA
jgi:hypothetical protein